MEPRRNLSFVLSLQYFVNLLTAKGTLKKDVKESIFSSIEAIYSVNQ